MKKRVLILVEDLIVAARVSLAATTCGVEICWAKSRAKALENLAAKPFDLIVVELQAYILQPNEFAKYVKKRDYGKNTPLVGFYREAKRLLIKEAEQSGYERIISKDEVQSFLQDFASGAPVFEIIDEKKHSAAEVENEKPSAADDAPKKKSVRRAPGKFRGN